MSGRRWGSGTPAKGAQEGTRPRPSERKATAPKAAAAQPKATDSSQTPPAPRAKAKRSSGPSADAMARARARMDVPKAPWHPLPLSELAIVLGALGMLVSAGISNERGLAASFLLVVAGTLEFSWREHRHGHRSHGALLAGTVAFPVGVLVWRAAGAEPKTAVLIGLAVFFVLWSAFTSSYRPKSERADRG